jgi:acyl carrier protein
MPPLPVFDPRSIAVAGAVLILAAVLAFHFVLRRRASRTVRSRSPLTAEQFAALFASDKECALAPAIRERLRRYITVDPARVLPDDELCKDLQLGAADGLDANEFVMDVESISGVKIPDADVAKMRTLRDVVCYAAITHRVRN